jgi:hypothetical protein
MKIPANFFACCFFPEACDLKSERPFLSEEFFNPNMNYYTQSFLQKSMQPEASGQQLFSYGFFQLIIPFSLYPTISICIHSLIIPVNSFTVSIIMYAAKKMALSF